MRNGRLLDIGSGFGEKSLALSKIGFKVIGVDSDLDRIKHSKISFPEITFYQYKITTDLPFEDNTFDVIFSCSVFQFFNHKQIIKECKRILKPNGKIIMIENLRNNPLVTIGRYYLRIIKSPYQPFFLNHLKNDDIFWLTMEFNNILLKHFYFLAPLCCINFAKGMYGLFEFLDRQILKSRYFKRFAWFILFAASNRKP